MVDIENHREMEIIILKSQMVMMQDVFSMFMHIWMRERKFSFQIWTSKLGTWADEILISHLQVVLVHQVNSFLSVEINSTGLCENIYTTY